MDRIYSNSGVSERHTVLPDFLRDDPSRFSFFPGNRSLAPLPSIEDRMKVYREKGVSIAEAAARRALRKANLSPRNVTDLIFVSCTGQYAPGPDTQLVQKLNLPQDTRRKIIGFMGCYAGFNGMETAVDIIRSRPDAVVLLVSLELCTIHFQKDFSHSGIVADCIFSDGAAATVYTSEHCEKTGERPIRIADSTSRIINNTNRQMTWDLGSEGFRMVLKSDVPRKIKNKLGSVITELYDTSSRNPEDMRWALHPGGKKILDESRSFLNLNKQVLSASYKILNRFGNMSSATIFFVLKQLLNDSETNQDILAAGFGPGLTIKATRIEVP